MRTVQVLLSSVEILTNDYNIFFYCALIGNCYIKYNGDWYQNMSRQTSDVLMNGGDIYGYFKKVNDIGMSELFDVSVARYIENERNNSIQITFLEVREGNGKKKGREKNPDIEEHTRKNIEYIKQYATRDTKPSYDIVGGGVGQWGTAIAREYMEQRGRSFTWIEAI